MPRPLVVGNGNLLVTLDSNLDLRDLYWPRVGLFNHLSGHRARIGLWADGRFSWLDSHEWRRTLRYEPGTLVTLAEAEHPGLGITLHIADAVLYDADVLVRRIAVRNELDVAREGRLFLTYDFHIAESDIGDTAFYNPYVDAVVHFKRTDYLLCAARAADTGLYQYAVGIKGFGGAEGTWRDAEDGELSMNAVAQGSVDSVQSVRFALKPRGDAVLHAWICLGHDLDSVTTLHRRIERADAAHDVDALLDATRRHWAHWSARAMAHVGAVSSAQGERVPAGLVRRATARARSASTVQAGKSTSGDPGAASVNGCGLPQPVLDLFRRSLLTIRTNIDNDGAVIAANDTDIMETARAHYSYMWPRDGALVAEALDHLGCHDLSRRFFEFCARVLPHDRPVLLHKYSADGSWGSTWHPWIVGGHREVPFQQDSTNLVLWALWRRFELSGDRELLERLYAPLVAPAADFIAGYRNAITGLPLPSYDLWEERRGVHAYTCGTLYGALAASASIAELLGDTDRAGAYRAAADEVREGMARYLWDSESDRFLRRLTPMDAEGTGAEHWRDTTIDSAIHAIWAYGAFGPADPRVRATMKTVVTRLWVRTDIGGTARYEDDYYFRRSGDIDRVPGNPWIICTLWTARWYIAQASRRAELATALDLLLWVCNRAMSSGILPEQVHPETGEPLSVAPLTWSHAEFISTVIAYRERYTELPD